MFCTWNCRAAAVVASAIVGIVTAFLQITGVITLTVPFLWVAFGIAVGALALYVLVTAVGRRFCASLGVPLTGILGTTLFALILLAVGITATSVLSAVLSGLLLFFLSLIVTGSVCYIRCVTDCDD